MPPSAIEVLRYLSKLDMGMAGIDDICQEVGLSERGFGKAIRSLVTKGYVVMDGDQVYRLTDNGSAAAEELGDYVDEDADESFDDEMDDEDLEPITRRLVMVMPRFLTANQPAHVVVGFDPQDEPMSPLEIVVRLSVLNGEPSQPQEASFQLDSSADRQDFLVTPGPYTQARIMAQVYQLGPNPDDIAVAGGLYVDADVTTSGDPDDRVAFGADITLQPQD